MDFAVSVSNIIAINVVLVLSLNLLVGYTGIFTVSQAALYGLGAYGAALAAVRIGLPFPLVLCAGMLIAMMFGLILAVPSLRVSGDYLVIASIAMQALVSSGLLNLESVTNGPFGIVGIPTPTSDPVSYLPISIGLALICLGVMWLVVRSSFGLTLKTIRDDEIAAAAIGKNVAAFKATAYVISAAMAGLAGGVYASYVTFIDPTSFTITASVTILTLMVAGGSGSIPGSVVGAVLLISATEALRFVPLPNLLAANVRLAIYGFVLIFFMMVRSQGIVGERVLGPAVAESGAEVTTEDERSLMQTSEMQLPGPRSSERIAGERMLEAVVTESRAKVPTEDHRGLLQTSEAHLRGPSSERADPLLECDSLVAGYDGHMVLRKVSVRVWPGEIVVIIGHNGSGKSTLLNAMIGLIKVRAGRIILRGRDVTNTQLHVDLDDGIGLVPQAGGVLSAMTVEDNLRLSGYLMRRNSRQLASRLEHIYDIFPELHRRSADKAVTLSGGQQRMLGVAMALVVERKLLLLDEPSIGLSPAMVKTTLTMIQRVHRELGAAIVMNEQNVRPALEIADRAYVLKAGTVALESRADALAGRPDLWKLF